MSTTYSAWVSDSEGNRLYTTSGHATRQEAIDQAWKRYPGARTVASGKGANGWEDVQFQTAVARRIETGAPEPTGEAWDGSESEQSWEMTPEAAERNAKFAAFANSAQGRAQERVCIKRALRAAGVEITASILEDAAALRELAAARGVTPYTWEQVKARNAHFAAVAASTLITNTLPASEPCRLCDAQTGEPHSAACPMGERYRQVQAMGGVPMPKMTREQAAAFLADDIDPALCEIVAGWDVAEPGPEQVPPHLRSHVAALSPTYWSQLAKLPGDANTGSRANEYETLVELGVAERKVEPIYFDNGRPRGSHVFFRLVEREARP